MEGTAANAVASPVISRANAWLVGALTVGTQTLTPSGRLLNAALKRVPLSAGATVMLATLKVIPDSSL